MSPEELAMKKKADETDQVVEEEEKKVKEKLEKEGFFARLKPYNVPFINVILGTMVSVI